MLRLPLATFHPLTLHLIPPGGKGTARVVWGLVHPHPGACILSLCPSSGPLSLPREKQGSSEKADFSSVCSTARQFSHRGSQIQPRHPRAAFRGKEEMISCLLSLRCPARGLFGNERGLVIPGGFSFLWRGIVLGGQESRAGERPSSAASGAGMMQPRGEAAPESAGEFLGAFLPFPAIAVEPFRPLPHILPAFLRKTSVKMHDGGLFVVGGEKNPPNQKQGRVALSALCATISTASFLSGFSWGVFYPQGSPSIASRAPQAPPQKG